MTKLRDDTFARRGRSAPRGRYISAIVFVLIFTSVALLILSRLNHPYIDTMRQALIPLFAPVLTAVSKPMQPVRNLSARVETMFVSHDELEKLRRENQALKSWEWRARDLQRQLEAVSRLAKLGEKADTPFVTARVVADATGPFSRSVVIDVGTGRGVRNGHPVINADGFVGRVVETSATAARVLLLSDAEMRVPVVIGRENQRGIIVGDNGARPRVTHLKREAKLKAGDVVATSGRGGLYPRSLRIGAIEKLGRNFVVRPFADLNRLDFVSILLFDSPILSLAGEPSAKAPRKVR